MMHPTFDSGGYPTDETLKRIHSWNLLEEKNLGAFLAFLKEAWHGRMVEWEKAADGSLEVYLATGGWSGNEDIISALEVTLFWGVAWEQSKRGGGYWFRLPPGVVTLWGGFGP